MDSNSGINQNKMDRPLERPNFSFHSIPFNKKLKYMKFNNLKLGANLYDKLPLEIKRFRLTPQGKATIAILISTGLVTYVGLDLV